jgi:subtilisin family serine protease
VVLVAAAGNEGGNSVSYPARYPNVIAVAATDSSNSHAAFSNYGPEVDLSAPGVSIVSTRPGGYGYGNGTSMSTPYVSGLAAILRGIPGNDSPAAIAQQMTSTALDLGLPGWDDFYGHGLIQMDTAIQSLWVVPTPVSSPAKNTPSTSLLNLSDGFVKPPTVSPSQTDNSLPTQPETATALPTFSFTDTPAFVVTGTPEVIALEAQIPEEAAASNWFLPGCGLSLILAGIALFWMAQRERKKNRKVTIQFR